MSGARCLQDTSGAGICHCQIVHHIWLHLGSRSWSGKDRSEPFEDHLFWPRKSKKEHLAAEAEAFFWGHSNVDRVSGNHPSLKEMWPRQVDAIPPLTCLYCTAKNKP